MFGVAIEPDSIWWRYRGGREVLIGLCGGQVSNDPLRHRVVCSL